jgi:hypothetical protein
MGLYISVDFHPYQQTVAYCDTGDGEIMFRTFKHSEREKLEGFYGSFDKRALVGVEATGGLDWFEEMIFEKGHKTASGAAANERCEPASGTGPKTRGGTLYGQYEERENHVADSRDV